jgi:hypothetical protein
MTPYRRRIILTRVLDPKYKHPKSMRLDLRMRRLFKRLYSVGAVERVLSAWPMLAMVKRG